MDKILSLLIILIISSACSFQSNSNFWTSQKKIKKEGFEFVSVYKEKEILSKEFNQNYEISLSKLKINDNSRLDNNDGYSSYRGELKNKAKYNFSRIKNFNLFDPNLIIHKENIIFFDNNGSILSFNNKSKLNWKINNYSKDDKKNGPLLNMAHNNKMLVVADNLAMIYSLDINTGNLLWSKKYKTPFNSQVKIFNDKILVIDSSNNLNCFSIYNGDLIWSFRTEKSFVNSVKKLSLIIKDNIVVFNNSLGDITAVDLNKGSLIWQISTQNSQIYEQIMKLKTSSIIENQGSIYFSNNKNQFFSIDFQTGIINWIQNINSDLKPAVIGNFIFTISLDGYFFVIEKDSGNILRITNLLNNSKLDKKDLYPTGFIFNSKDLFVSTNLGKLIIVDMKVGRVKNILKIDNNKISRGFSDYKNIFVIKDNSIIKLN